MAALGAILIFLSTQRYGSGISPDSVGYIRVARNIANGTGFTIQKNLPLVAQPPLYPTILALSSVVVKIDPLGAARAISVFLFGFNILLASYLLTKPVASLPLIIGGPLFFLFSPALFQVSTMAWTEPLFISLTLLTFISIQSYLENKRIESLFLCSMFISLATLTRYIGLTLILWGAITILFIKFENPQKKLWHLSIFFLISGTPLGGWVIRNYHISGTFFGARPPSPYTFFQNISFVFQTLSDWYLPDKNLFRAFSLFSGVGLMIGSRLTENWQRIYKGLHKYMPLFLFVFLYTAALVFSSSIAAFDQIGDRLLSPIYIPLTLCLFIFLEDLTGSLRKIISRNTTHFLLLIFLAVGLISPVWKTLRVAKDHYQDGKGYHSKIWVKSKTIKYLHYHEELRTQCTFYTNAPDALYILADLKAEMSPMERRYNSPQKIQDIQDLKGSWPPTQNACLIWFEHAGRPYLFSLAELREAAILQEIEEFRNGAIYTVRRK